MGGLTDDNRIWMGARNGLSFGRWDINNPKVTVMNPMDNSKYYLIMGRIESGTGMVKIQLFINGATPEQRVYFRSERKRIPLEWRSAKNGMLRTTLGGNHLMVRLADSLFMKGIFPMTKWKPFLITF